MKAQIGQLPLLVQSWPPKEFNHLKKIFFFKSTQKIPSFFITGDSDLIVLLALKTSLNVRSKVVLSNKVIENQNSIYAPCSNIQRVLLA